MQLRYQGTADIRKISKSEFAVRNLDHEAVTWDSSNNWTAEVSSEVGHWLMENEGKDWKQAEEKKTNEEPLPKRMVKDAPQA